MPRKSDIPIYVDSSCLTDSTDLQQPSKPKYSDQKVYHNQIEYSHTALEGGQVGSEVSPDEHTEALIHAAARAVVASIEQDRYGQEDSIIGARTEDGYEAGTELTYGDETELTYGGTAELDYGSDGGHIDQDPYDGSGSSHRGDDIFSQGAQSNRSSINSCTDGEEHWKRDQDHKLGNEHQPELVQEPHSPISRIPSMTSNVFSHLPGSLTLTSSPPPLTPTKVRPAFRTPSSVRAIQMSSPTPSIIAGSSRSSKRPTASHLGTPNSQSPTKTKTPARFKAKKEYPLVLLHVTVIPLQWQYGNALDSVNGEGLPRELYSVKESWKLLKEKLADTVLERGILLPHPQDLYEMLEERLLEALELPVRPRAKILTCGHYLGPEETENSSSEDGSENEEDTGTLGSREQWCDICGREVRYEEFSMGGRRKRFRIKVYASNGLMRAGAWAAAWKEMERVDVEIEPFVPSHVAPLMESLMTFHAQSIHTQHVNNETVEHHHEGDGDSERRLQQEREEEEVEAMNRKEREEERMREIYGDIPPATSDFDNMRPQQAPSVKQKYGDSLPELAWAAIKVLLRDKKQVAICILSVLVLILALRPGGASHPVVGEYTISKAPAAGADLTIGTNFPGTGQEAINKAVTSEEARLVQCEQLPIASTKDKVLELKTQEVLYARDESREEGMDKAEEEGKAAVENMVTCIDGVIVGTGK